MRQQSSGVQPPLGLLVVVFPDTTYENGEVAVFLQGGCGVPTGSAIATGTFNSLMSVVRHDFL